MTYNIINNILNKEIKYQIIQKNDDKISLIFKLSIYKNKKFLLNIFIIKFILYIEIIKILKMKIMIKINNYL